MGQLKSVTSGDARKEKGNEANRIIEILSRVFHFEVLLTAKGF
jgi:hypothetical protein